MNEDILYSINNEGFSTDGDMILHITIDNINTDILQDNEKTVLKKILVKCDLDEFKKEVSIINNKDNLIKTNIKKYSMKNQNNQHYHTQHFEVDEEPTNCTTQ